MTSPTAGFRRRRSIGGALLALGALCALVAYNGLVIRAIVVDGDLAERAATTAIEDERMHHILVDATAEAIGTQYLGGAVEQLARMGYDTQDDVRAMAEAVVADPRFVHEFASAVRGLHEFVLVDHSSTPAVDATASVAAARAAAIARNPAYAALLPAGTALRIELPAGGLPDLTGTTAALAEWSKAAALAAVALTAAAFAVHSHRPTVIHRVGCWALTIAIVQGAAALLLVRLAPLTPHDIEPLAQAVATTLRPRLLVPAVMLAAAGGALVIGAWRWKASLDATHERYGATAFLAGDADDPFAGPALAPGTIETAVLRSPMGAPPVSRVSPRTDVLPTTARGA